MSRISKLIDDLETLHEQDIKNSARVYGITATLFTRLQELLNNLDDTTQSLPQGRITQKELITLYGSYNNAYAVYQKAYGIKCKKGWNHFLKAIEGLTPPTTLEKRVEKLEQTVKMLVKVLLESQ